MYALYDSDIGVIGEEYIVILGVLVRKCIEKYFDASKTSLQNLVSSDITAHDI